MSAWHNQIFNFSSSLWPGFRAYHVFTPVFFLSLLLGMLPYLATNASAGVNPSFQHACHIKIIQLDKNKVGSNIISNSGFEIFSPENLLVNWRWKRRNTDAILTVVQASHSGFHAVNIKNSTAKKPHVYCQLVQDRPLRLEPGRFYTLSAYIKCGDARPAAWIGGGGKRWWLRLKIPNTRNQWQRISRTFIAAPEDREFHFMAVADGPADFSIDDIKLEQGRHATRHFNSPLNASDNWIEPGDPVLPLADRDRLEMPFYLYNGTVPPKSNTLRLELVNTDSGKTIYQHEQPEFAPQGLSVVKLSCPLAPLSSRNLQLRFKWGGTKAKQDISHRFESFGNAAQNARQCLNRLETHYRSLTSAGKDDAYVRAALAIARRFTRTAFRKATKNLVKQATGDLEFIAELCTTQTDRITAILQDEIPAVTLPDNDLRHVKISNGNFYTQDGSPVLFAGAMGYGELYKELGTYRDYGFNAIGNDFDYFSKLWSVMQPDGKINTSAFERLSKDMRLLADMNLATAFNPAIHTKLPEWAVKQYPDIVGGPQEARQWLQEKEYSHDPRSPGKYGHFFRFSIDSQGMKKLVSEYYHAIIPRIKSVPGLHLLWLMNEPAYSGRDRQYIRLFQKYLTDHFKHIEDLNRAWGTSYSAFTDISTRPGRSEPGRFDWLCFHQEQVSKWYDWLATEIRGIDKGMLLSNKPHAGNLFRPESGIDFEHEAGLWDVIGFDAVRRPDSKTYSFDWSQPAMMLDFFKSVAPEKPLADLEFHYVHQPDVTADYVRTAYFQSYLHGLRMSQFWIWATGNFGTDYTYPGLKYTPWSQPQAAWGTAKAAIDLRRMAEYISAFPGKAEVMIYYSRPSLFLDTKNYRETVRKTYELLNGLGAPVGFITDRMIRNGRLRDCKLLVIPGARYVERDVLSRIAAYAKSGGKLLLVGDNCLQYDQYMREYARQKLSVKKGVGCFWIGSKVCFSKKTLKSIDELYDKSGITRLIKIYGKDGLPAWPVEYRSVEIDGKLVCYILGLNKEPADVFMSKDSGIEREWIESAQKDQKQVNCYTILPNQVYFLAPK